MPKTFGNKQSAAIFNYQLQIFLIVDYVRNNVKGNNDFPIDYLLNPNP